MNRDDGLEGKVAVISGGGSGIGRALAVAYAPLDEDYGYVSLEAMLSSKAVVTCADSGGPRDFAGNPAPLFTDWRAPNRDDVGEGLDVPFWIVQRDERLGATWYEACLRVVP